MTPDQAPAAIALRSAKAVARDLGHPSTINLWRWRKNGWIKSVTIAGTVYIDLSSLNEFFERAKTGQFATQFHGVAAQSHKGGDV